MGWKPTLVMGWDPTLVMRWEPILVVGSRPSLVRGWKPTLAMGSKPILVLGLEPNRQLGGSIPSFRCQARILTTSLQAAMVAYSSDGLRPTLVMGWGLLLWWDRSLLL